PRGTVLDYAGDRQRAPGLRGAHPQPGPGLARGLALLGLARLLLEREAGRVEVAVPGDVRNPVDQVPEEAVQVAGDLLAGPLELALREALPLAPVVPVEEAHHVVEGPPVRR